MKEIRVTNETKKKETQCVFKGSIARKLVEEGYTIVGLKPNKHNRMKTVFVFRIVPGFETRLEELITSEREKKTKRRQLRIHK